MGETKKNKSAQKLRTLKRWGLPLGIMLIIVGYVILSVWGFTRVKTWVDWYVVDVEKLNGIGVCGTILIIIGVVVLVLWLIAVIILKSTTPCPACGGLLTQRSSVCPYCKSSLSWGNLDEHPANGTQQTDRSVRYCQFCGTKAEPGNLYCQVCGKQLSK